MTRQYLPGWGYYLTIERAWMGQAKVYAFEDRSSVGLS